MEDMSKELKDNDGVIPMNENNQIITVDDPERAELENQHVEDGANSVQSRSSSKKSQGVEENPSDEDN